MNFHNSLKVMHSPNESNHHVFESEYWQECDHLVRVGQISEVRQRLKNIKPSQIPRRFLIAAGSLARRVGIASVGIRFMRPVVRPNEDLSNQAESSEKAEYAALLIREGLLTEAFSVLSACDGSLPEVALYTGFAHMNEWNYAAAIPLFENYLKNIHILPYQAAVAKVNLASALLFTRRLSKAESLLAEVFQETSAHQWTLLQRNALELLGQLAFARRRWAEARRLLFEIPVEANSDDTWSQLYVKKWRVLVQLAEHGPNELILKALSQVRIDAHRLRDWETVRACDHSQAIATLDQKLALRVYFGTPFSSFQNRVELDTKRWLSVPNEYVHCFQFEHVERIFDLHEAREISGAAVLPKGQVLHRLFHALCEDFYRPQSTGRLFSKIFVGEYFNPASSPKRTFQAIQRLRQFFMANHIPLSIKQIRGEYHLVAIKPYGVKMVLHSNSQKQSGTQETSTSRLGLLKLKWPYKSFSSGQAAETLALSPRTIKTLLSDAVANGLIYRSGQGRGTLYRFMK